MCNFPGDVGSRDPSIRSGAGSRAPPQALRPASGKGMGSAGLPSPGPSCPPGHHGGRVPAAPGAERTAAAEKFGVRGRRGPLPRAQLLPGDIPASAAPGDRGALSPRCAPAPAEKCGGGALRRGVPLGAAGGARRAGWRAPRRPLSALRPAACCSCAARRRSEPRRRGSAEPGAARAGEAGRRRGSERYPAAAAGRAQSGGGGGAGAAGAFPPLPGSCGAGGSCRSPPSLPRCPPGCGSSSSPLQLSPLQPPPTPRCPRPLRQPSNHQRLHPGKGTQHIPEVTQKQNSFHRIIKANILGFSKKKTPRALTPEMSWQHLPDNIPPLQA